MMNAETPSIVLDCGMPRSFEALRQTRTQVSLRCILLASLRLDEERLASWSISHPHH